MRISLNLSEGIVKKVDSLVDGKEYRNRSHAVEKILSNAISPNICKKAVMLVGGREEPHPSVFRFDDKTLVEHNFRVLKEIGAEEVFFIGNNLDNIQEALGDTKGAKSTFVEEKEPLGTAGALNLVEKQIKKPFIVMNGDIYVDFDVENMIGFYSENRAIATLALGTTGRGSVGRVKVKGTDLLSFQETGEIGTDLVNIGFYILNPNIFDCLPKKGMMEQEVFPRLAKERRINSYLIGGEWKHITKPEDLKE